MCIQLCVKVDSISSPVHANNIIICILNTCTYFATNENLSGEKMLTAISV